MAIILFRCPFCGKKVETPEDNVGREGLCPGCQKIFEIPEPGKKEAARAVRSSGAIGLAAGGAPEYEELAALLGAGAIAVGLAGLLATTFLPWVQDWTGVQQALAPQKGYIVVGSAACLAFLLISALTRKSLMPPVLAGAAWGTFSLVWTATIARTMSKAVSSGSSSPLAIGTYLAIGACVIALLGAGFIYYQVRNSSVMERFGLFLVVTQVAVLVGALLLASHCLKPTLAAFLPKEQPAAQQPERPGRTPQARPRGQR